MKLKFVSELIQIASLRFIEALKGSKITIAKTLVKPCLLDCAKIVLDDKAYNKLK